MVDGDAKGNTHACPPQTQEPDDDLNDEEQFQRRLKRSRTHCQCEAELEREHLQRSFAMQRELLEADLATLHRELAEYRGRYWEVQLQLDDAQAQLAALPTADFDGADEEEHAEMTEAIAGHLREQMQRCQAESRRYYYPTSIGCLPRLLQQRGANQTNFTAAIALVKEDVKQATIERRRAKKPDG